jgi:hypothetical protein
MYLGDRGFNLNGEFVTFSRIINLANFVITNFLRA